MIYLYCAVLVLKHQYALEDYYTVLKLQKSLKDNCIFTEMGAREREAADSFAAACAGEAQQPTHCGAVERLRMGSLPGTTSQFGIYRNDIIKVQYVRSL